MEHFGNLKLLIAQGHFALASRASGFLDNALTRQEIPAVGELVAIGPIVGTDILANANQLLGMHKTLSLE